jgi:hypothetical protein
VSAGQLRFSEVLIKRNQIADQLFRERGQALQFRSVPPFRRGVLRLKAFQRVMPSRQTFVRLASTVDLTLKTRRKVFQAFDPRIQRIDSVYRKAYLGGNATRIGAIR